MFSYVGILNWMGNLGKNPIWKFQYSSIGKFPGFGNLYWIRTQGRQQPPNTQILDSENEINCWEKDFAKSVPNIGGSYAPALAVLQFECFCPPPPPWWLIRGRPLMIWGGGPEELFDEKFFSPGTASENFFFFQGGFPKIFFSSRRLPQKFFFP